MLQKEIINNLQGKFDTVEVYYNGCYNTLSTNDLISEIIRNELHIYLKGIEIYIFENGKNKFIVSDNNSIIICDSWGKNSIEFIFS